MQKHFETVTDERGNALVGYRVRVKDDAGVEVEIYSDRGGTRFTENGFPINEARTDSLGYVQFYWEPEFGQVREVLDPSGDLKSQVEDFFPFAGVTADDVADALVAVDEATTAAAAATTASAAAVTAAADATAAAATATTAVSARFEPATEPTANEDGVFAVIEATISGDAYVPYGFIRATGESVVSPPESQTARAWDNRIGPKFGRAIMASAIRYMPWNGQSWAVGGGQAIDKVTTQNPSVVSSAPWNPYSLMFNGGMRNKNSGVVELDRIADLVPASERYDAYAGSYQGETPCSGMMAQFHFLQSFERRPLNYLLSKVHGRGNTAIADLSKGATYSCYENGLTELTKAITLANKYGRSIYCPHIFFQQGEADLATAKATYKTAVTTLLSDYRSDWDGQLAAQYSGHPSVKMIIGQLAASTAGTGSPIMLAHEELARENPNDIYLVGPWYFLELGLNTSHPNAQSYALMGEYFARASFELEANGSYEPHWLDHTYGTNGVTRSGSTITLKTKPRLGELVLDTTTLPAFNNGAGGSGGVDTYGFSYVGANIVSVAITATNTITITLDAAASGTLRYAYDGVNLGSGFTRPGAWGNFRDGGGTLGASAHLMSRTDKTKLMWNWLCTFERAVA